MRACMQVCVCMYVYVCVCVYACAHRCDLYAANPEFVVSHVQTEQASTLEEYKWVDELNLELERT